jgi:hypothetical protein
MCTVTPGVSLEGVTLNSVSDLSCSCFTKRLRSERERTRPAPVKTSSRRTGSVIALCTVSIPSYRSKPNRRLADQNIIRKVAAKRRLLSRHLSMRMLRLMIVHGQPPSSLVPLDNGLPSQVGTTSAGHLQFFLDAGQLRLSFWLPAIWIRM